MKIGIRAAQEDEDEVATLMIVNPKLQPKNVNYLLANIRAVTVFNVTHVGMRS